MIEIRGPPCIEHPSLGLPQLVRVAGAHEARVPLRGRPPGVAVAAGAQGVVAVGGVGVKARLSLAGGGVLLCRVCPIDPFLDRAPARRVPALSVGRSSVKVYKTKY